MMLDNSRVIVKYIVEVMDILEECFFTCNQHLDRRKIRMDISLFYCNKSQFRFRFIIVVGTWICCYAKENTVKTVNCVGKQAPKKEKTVCSTCKMTAPIFWDRHEVILNDQLEEALHIFITNHYKLQIETGEKVTFAFQTQRLRLRKFSH